MCICAVWGHRRRQTVSVDVGVTDVTRPCEFTQFGAIDVTKPFQFIWGPPMTPNPEQLFSLGPSTSPDHFISDWGRRCHQTG